MLNLIIFSSLFCIILSSCDCSELLQQWIKSWKQIRAQVDCMQLWWIAAYMHDAVFCCMDNNLHLALAHKLNTALRIMRGCRFKIDPVISVLQTSPHRCNYRAIISANIEADYCKCGGCCKNKMLSASPVQGLTWFCRMHGNCILLLSAQKGSTRRAKKLAAACREICETCQIEQERSVCN